MKERGRYKVKHRENDREKGYRRRNTVIAKGEGTYGYSAREREGDIERKGEGDINRESK